MEAFNTAIKEDRNLKFSKYLTEHAGGLGDVNAGHLGLLLNSLLSHLREIYDGRAVRVRFEDFDDYIDD